MRKEIILAVVTGSLVGLVIAFGVWRTTTAFKSQDKEESPPVQVQKATSGLTIAAPENNEVIIESPASISGVSEKATYLTISAEGEDHIIMANEEGAFAEEVKLVGGINDISVFAFLEAKSEQENLQLVHSAEFAKYLETEEEEESTQSADAVRQKVQEKLEAAKLSLLAYIGTITDLTEETIQIKNGSGEIKQASVEGTVDFLKIQKSSQVIKFSDLAIGDFVIAMGFKNGNGVLKTKRVLVTTKPVEIKRIAVLGEILELTKNEIKLKNQEKTWTAKLGKSWVGPDVDELSQGDQLIIAGTATEEASINVRTIKKLSS